jgi:glycosyltransferase domain-containing protein
MATMNRGNKMSSSKELLTVLIPLKGRDEYTVRISKYLNHINTPFRVLFADGGESTYIENFFKDKDNLPDLKYDYLRYPYDKTMSNFHSKMASATMAIKTPYTLLHDNDDFFITETIQKCISFLNQNPDYNTARGKIHDFHVSRGAYGEPYITGEMYTEYRDPVDSDTVQGRLLDQCSRFHSNYHNVRRTRNVQMTYKLIEIMDFTNYRFAHQAESLLSVAWGKGTRQVEGPHLLHQASTMSVGSEHFPPQDQWIRAEYWKDDFVGMMDLCGALIHHYDNAPLLEAREIFANGYVRKLPNLKDLLMRKISLCKEQKVDNNRIHLILEAIKAHDTESTILATNNTEHSTAQEEFDLLKVFLNSRL